MTERDIVCRHLRLGANDKYADGTLWLRFSSDRCVLPAVEFHRLYAVPPVDEMGKRKREAKFRRVAS